MIELLCVMAIIAVLASLLLGAVGRAFHRAKTLVGEFDSGAHVDELRTKVSQYAAANPQFPTLTLDDLVKQCRLSSRCERFLRSREVSYQPFGASSPDTMIVLQVFRGKSGVIAYPKGFLVTPDSGE